jgi:PadR family transcriptional regulator PadR
MYGAMLKRVKGLRVRLDQDLTAASATPLILTILSEGESYGYTIIKRIRHRSQVELEWTDAMVYPLFHRLRRLGYLTTQWRTLPEGQRRRYYAITEDGRAALGGRQRRPASARRVLKRKWGGLGWLLTTPLARDLVT